MKRSTIFSLALGMAVMAGLPAHGVAAGCTASDFGAIVDQTAQALRDLNLSGAKRFQEKIAAVRQKSGLSQEEMEARAAAIQDSKIEEFNREIDKLVNRMDALSQTPNNQVTCEKLNELKRVRDQLLTLMGQKSGYMLARADSLLDQTVSGGRPAKPNVATASTEQPRGETSVSRTESRVVAPPAPVAAAPAAPTPVAPTPEVKPEAKPALVKPEAKPAAKPTQNAAAPTLPERRPPNTQTATNTWKTEQRQVGRPPAPAPAQPYAPQAPTNLAPQTQDGVAPLLPPTTPVGGTFSNNEIRDAGTGVFGTITAEFAGAIDYAFQHFGQPNAYITGGEGGGAFLAGLRYGNGVLHRKGYPDTPIFWQGPSAGLDLGAEGSKTLFLVYNLEGDEGIYGRFSGIGGQAYVAGGVGINVLGKGRVVMVPIRSGIGLRLGASLAYLKFTDRQTWNPF